MAETARNPIDLLEALGPRGRKAIEHEAEWFAIPAGHTLFRQGDDGDDLYLVASGSLGVYQQRPSGDLRLLALIQAGETVGEMALISGERRSATVIAIRDSELLRLSREKFDRLLKRQPELLKGINRLLVERLRHASSGRRPHIEPKTVGFLPANPMIQSDLIAAALAQRLETLGYRVRLVGPESAGQTSEWFNKLEAEYDHIFLHGTLDNTAWVRLCARQSDRILVVASADRVENQLPEDILKERSAHQLLDLVLAYDRDTGASGSATDWLELLPFNRHYHLREKNENDWSRLARAILGQSVGLVLSGGGARAFSQIGVLKALQDEGIPVDAVGGASMGAVLAAGIGMEWGVDELKERIHESFVKSNPLSDVTLPLLGIIKGRKVERLLVENFGEADIPDLWLPFFCVSSNLSNGDLYIHSRGPVTKALRASISLPGVLPPVIEQSNILVDGAVINNLPVDIMRTMHQGPIMAVDVARDRSMKPEMLAMGSEATTWSQIKRLPILSILMRSGTVSGEAQNTLQALNADLLLEPPLGEIEIRNWGAFDEAVEIGYEHASAMLSGAGYILRPKSNTAAPSIKTAAASS